MWTTGTLPGTDVGLLPRLLRQAATSASRPNGFGAPSPYPSMVARIFIPFATPLRIEPAGVADVPCPEHPRTAKDFGRGRHRRFPGFALLYSADAKGLAGRIHERSLAPHADCADTGTRTVYGPIREDCVIVLANGVRATLSGNVLGCKVRGSVRLSLASQMHVGAASVRSNL